MHISNVTISGFKSYRDEVSIDLDPACTVISAWVPRGAHATNRRSKAVRAGTADVVRRLPSLSPRVMGTVRGGWRARAIFHPHAGVLPL